VGKTDQLPAWDAKIVEALKDAPQGMLEVAEFFLERELNERDPKLLLLAARRANELLGGEEAEALATLAQVYCELGMIDQAVLTQEKAAKHAGEFNKGAYEKVLAYYKGAQTLAKGESAVSAAPVASSPEQPKQE